MPVLFNSCSIGAVGLIPESATRRQAHSTKGVPESDAQFYTGFLIQGRAIVTFTCMVHIR